MQFFFFRKDNVGDSVASLLISSQISLEQTLVRTLTTFPKYKDFLSRFDVHIT